ncbi:MAG TPA: hypothetical protein DCE58_05935 [Cryomorphaceae bacterium]|nr:hypothetical protein [Cryomorphaceae bacterium]
MKRFYLLFTILFGTTMWAQNVAIEVPHAFQGTHFKTFLEQGEQVRTWYEVSGRYSEDYMEVVRRIYQPNKGQSLRILDTYGDDGYTAVKIESRGWIYILIQSNSGMAESKIQARMKEPRD